MVTESLVRGGTAWSGFASWSSRAGNALLGLGTEGPELPQQRLRAPLYGFNSGGSTLAAHQLQEVVEVGAGITKVDVGEDPRQRSRRQDTRLGLSHGAEAKGDIPKGLNQEGKQL